MSEAPPHSPAFLEATEFLDRNHPAIQALAEEVRTQGGGPREQAIRLYYLVRDRYRYDPYRIDFSREGMKASAVIARGYGFCITKSVLYAAAARALGIPSRLGFADVRNHLATPRLLELLGTDTFYYHGYADLWLQGAWVKATPAFNLSLCEKFRVKPLEFDGKTDSIFHPFDADDRRHMEYIRDHGTRPDLPYEELRTAMLHYYPVYRSDQALAGDFAAEAEAESALK